MLVRGTPTAGIDWNSDDLFYCQLMCASTSFVVNPCLEYLITCTIPAKWRTSPGWHQFSSYNLPLLGHEGCWLPQEGLCGPGYYIRLACLSPPNRV